MSNALAIAAVTQVLKGQLYKGIEVDTFGAIEGDIVVSALPPDSINVADANQLNLFMYRVTPNTGWSNVDYPSHNSQGERTSNPPLSLDLHYLLTAYGKSELQSEILLGGGMQVLHEYPVLGRDYIQKSLSPGSSASTSLPASVLTALSNSELAEQMEQIKISPEPLSTEEISKLWAAFQSKYRPSAAYLVSVILIESKKSTKSALPVKERLIYTLPFRKPEIEKVLSKKILSEPAVENQRILPGYFLVLKGKQLKGEFVEINISGNIVSPELENISDSQIVVRLPDSLSAGIQGAQVIHQNNMGSPPLPHRGMESNVAAFVLSPKILNQEIDPTNSAGGFYEGKIKLEVIPVIGEKQRVTLIMNKIKELLSPPDTTTPLSYSFSLSPVNPLSPPDPFLTFSIKGVKAGKYLLRIQVDGAESPLETDATGKYNKPQVTIP